MRAFFSRRVLRVPLDELAERALQRTEPLFVVAPLVHALGVQRLAHLLGTEGRYGAPVLVEAQALLLEGQAAVLDHPAQLAFRVLTSCS